jgi:hypothetical protein
LHEKISQIKIFLYYGCILGTILGISLPNLKVAILFIKGYSIRSFTYFVKFIIKAIIIYISVGNIAGLFATLLIRFYYAFTVRGVIKWKLLIEYESAIISLFVFFVCAAEVNYILEFFRFHPISIIVDMVILSGAILFFISLCKLGYFATRRLLPNVI